MKTSILFVAALALTAAPTLVRADSPDATVKHATRLKTVNVATAPRVLRKDVEYVYITSQTPTGSHIPLIVRRYNDWIDTSSPTNIYSRDDLSMTGASDVGSELVRRDPAIGFGHGTR